MAEGFIPVIPEFTGDNFFLSNFYVSSITLDGPGGFLIFPTAEHLFQSLKHYAMTDQSQAEAYVRKVISNPEPNWSKKMGRNVDIDVAKWDGIKNDAMRRTVWEKFRQNPELIQRLLDTGPAMLVEGNTWGDTYWGRCKGQGYNILGSILMEVRGYYHWR